MWISFRQEPKNVLTAPTVSTWEEAGASPPTDFSDRMAWPESLVVLDCFLGRMNLFLFRILTMYYSPFVLSRCVLSLFLLSFEFTSRCLFATEPDDILKTRKAKKRGRFGVHLTCVLLAVLLPRPVAGGRFVNLRLSPHLERGWSYFMLWGSDSTMGIKCFLAHSKYLLNGSYYSYLTDVTVTVSETHL